MNQCGERVWTLIRAISYRMVYNRVRGISNDAVMVSPSDYIEISLEYHDSLPYCAKLIEPRTLMGMQLAHHDKVSDGCPIVTNHRGMKRAQIDQEERNRG